MRLAAESSGPIDAARFTHVRRAPGPSHSPAPRPQNGGLASLTATPVAGALALAPQASLRRGMAALAWLAVAWLAVAFVASGGHFADAQPSPAMQGLPQGHLSPGLAASFVAQR